MAVGGGGGGGAGARDIRAGGAYFEVFATDKLTPVLDKAKKSSSEFSDFMKGLRANAGKATLGLAAAGAASISGLFLGGVNRAAEIARISERFGLPIQLMAKLKHAADEAGVSIEEVMNDTTGRFTAAIDRAPGINEEEARKALKLQQDWNAALRDLQYAMLPLVEAVGPLVRGFADLAAAMNRMKPSEFFGELLEGRNPLEAKKTGGGAFAAAAKRIAAAAAAKSGKPDADMARLRAAIMSSLPATGVKGAFQVFNAGGQFGFGDKNEEMKKLTEIAKRLLNGEGQLPKVIGKELADALKPK